MSDWKAKLAAWKEAGEQVVFTNGVFDILHVGHVDYLTKARALGDRLVLGLNSDASVRRLNKGQSAPSILRLRANKYSKRCVASIWWWCLTPTHRCH